MGISNFMNKNGKKKGNVKKNLKRTVLKAKLAVLGLAFMAKFIPTLLLVITAATIFDWVIEIFTAKNTPEEIYTQLEIENVAELIQIKENEGEYYLDFIDGIDDKLDDLIETLNTSGEYHNVPKDKTFLKKLIQAEVVTQFPNLGGTPPESSSGFQGAIDIKRVTPNKAVGEMVNTGQDTTNVLESEESYNDSQITPREENIKEWQQGKNIEIYSNAYVYEKKEGVWIQRKVENTDTKIKIKKTSTITYEGEYEVSKDRLNNTIIIYVKVTGESTKGEQVTGFIKSSTINLRTTDEAENEQEENQGEQQDESQIETSSNNVQKNELNGKIQSKKIATSRANSREDNRIVVGDENEEYVVAIAAGHNNSDDKGARSGELKEEKLTILVAEKVQELVEERYKNVRVVQTGSTSSNPGGIKVEQRKQLARDANPDLCIQIHFNAAESADANGVEAIYKDGDGISQQLAEILSRTISQEMGLTDREAGPDIEKCAVGSLGIIENAAYTNFPSVVTEGGFLTGNVDANVIKNNGTDKYAEGIVKGIKEYLEADHTGYSSYASGETIERSSIESKVINMKYVPMDKLEELKTQDVETAIKYFSLNEDNKLVTLSWNKNGDGSIVIRENSPMDFRTSLQQYNMPFEYLLMYYIDTDYRGFSEKLADIVLDSEIVIALQDNVTTTHTVLETQQKVTAGENAPSNVAQDWHTIGTQSDTITESCSTKIDITYIETWCVKVYKDNSYSRRVLNMGDKDEIIVNVPGTVTETQGETTLSDETVVESGTRDTGREDSDGNSITYTYTVLNRTATTVDTIRNSYDTSGDTKIDEMSNKYVDLYIDERMNERMQEEWFFDIIENNERTANLLDLTKYLMFLATNVNYGVTEFDFEGEFEFHNFQNIDGFFGDWDGTGGPEDFIRAVAPYAVMNMEKHHIYASVTIAQAIIESGWGKGSIAIQYKNFFGMKAFDGNQPNEYWTGERVLLNASEGGQSYFRVYDSLKNAVFDYGRNFNVGTVYIENGVLDCISQDLGPLEQLRRLATAGYALYADGSIAKPDGVRPYHQFLYEEFIVKYNLEQYDSMTSADFQHASGDILGTCEEVMNDMISRNVRYSIGSLTWGNIEQSAQDPYACCATYVSIVLYKAGLLTADQINAYNYHWTGAGGVPTMLEAAGWTQVSHDQIQPGDIINEVGVHVLIYAGGDLVYDQNCGVVSSKGRPPIGGPYNAWNSRYKGKANVQVWRAP